MAANEKSESVKSISVDDLFEKQSQASSAATIEPVPGKAGIVKVTPWVASSRCLCHLAIEVPKVSIEHVTPTGEKHHCCGKILAVVEVKFHDKSQMAMSEVFGQLTAKATAGDESHHDQGAAPVRNMLSAAAVPPGCHYEWKLVCTSPPPPPPPRTTCFDGCDSTYNNCMANAVTDSDQCFCEEDRRACIAMCSGRRPPPRRIC